jgi:RNA polymerase sigma-70 factor (ECF subfamily)
MSHCSASLDAQLGVRLSDADDLIQDVLMVVLREVGGFRRQGKGAFRSWLRTVLLHRVRHYFRKEKNRPVATGDGGFELQFDQLESPESELSRRWDREHDEFVAASLLRQVEGDFAPVTWQAFRLCALEGQPVDKVAQELGLSTNSVLVAKSRVLKRLREKLGELTR